MPYDAQRIASGVPSHNAGNGFPSPLLLSKNPRTSYFELSPRTSNFPFENFQKTSCIPAAKRCSMPQNISVPPAFSWCAFILQTDRPYGAKKHAYQFHKPSKLSCQPKSWELKIRTSNFVFRTSNFLFVFRTSYFLTEPAASRVSVPKAFAFSASAPALFRASLCCLRLAFLCCFQAASSAYPPLDYPFLWKTAAY